MKLNKKMNSNRVNMMSMTKATKCPCVCINIGSVFASVYINTNIVNG